MTSKENIYNELDNDWAFDIKEEPIHISRAESGAKGYYCMGCHKEMQAAKGLKNKHYFRHHVKDVNRSNVECVNASKEYREKLAYFYFMRVKQIKLPTVYKYPPKGVEGIPVLLQEATTIHAHRVDREVTFFEDENGVIHWGKNTNVDNRFLMARPDAVFFDKEDKPILFIEFVITHKPDIDKLNKLKRLGINTVQIIVPKLAEAELEKSISQVSKVKWTYNEIESNTEYLPITTGNSEGIPSIDEEQRKLFEESYKCRAAQVGNLVRAINRCLESQSYRRVEQHFEQEIQRIENAASEHRSRLAEIQAGIENEIYSELAERRDELDKSEEAFQRYCSNLEGRYFEKRNLLREEQADTDREIEFRYRVGKSEDDIRREFERTEREYSYEETGIESEQEVIRKQEDAIVGDITENTTFENNFTGAEESIRTEFEELEKSEQEIFERTRKNLESKISGFRETKTEVETGIRSDFEREYQQIIERFNNRDIQGRDELSERIKSILELRRLFDSYSNGKEALGRYKKGIGFIKNGTWDEWDR